jgi:hypothetical protein
MRPLRWLPKSSGTELVSPLESLRTKPLNLRVYYSEATNLIEKRKRN